jgi:two-component system CheB/CheR fusion protein
VNKAAEAMIDLEPGTLLGTRMKEMFPTMDSFYYDKYVEVVEKGTPMQFEFYNKSLNRWYEVICVKMLDGLVTTFTNITEKKRAADLLRQGFEDLKVTTNKLETINTELERSNFDLLQFASVASHDLKEPLRKIQAYGNILSEKAKGKLDPKEQNYLSKVINSAKRMHTLVDDILTLSKLSNSQSLREPTDLNKIIARIIDDLEITISDRQAKINVGKLPIVTAVSGQIHQLFQNLIINALKFSNKDRPVVKIYEQPVTEQMMKEQNVKEDFACIVVEDNGIGFEEKYAEKIFGIFQRLNGANFQGTGIGLAICKKIMEKHDGMIYAQSKPGFGSKFYVLLPGKSKNTSPDHEHSEHKLA